MALHKKLAAENGAEDLLCRSPQPLQRGTTENTNGLIMQFLPNSTDLGVYSQFQFRPVCASAAVACGASQLQRS